MNCVWEVLTLGNDTYVCWQFWMSPVSRNLKLLPRFTRLASSVDNLKPLSSWIAWKARRFPDHIALHRCAMQPCSGQEYAGHLCADAKSAEKSAAEQALQATRCKLLSPIFAAKLRAFQTYPKLSLKQNASHGQILVDSTTYFVLVNWHELSETTAQTCSHYRQISF